MGSVALDPRDFGFTGTKAELTEKLDELSASLGNTDYADECPTVHAFRNGIDAIPDDGSQPESEQSLRDIAAKIAKEAKDHADGKHDEPKIDGPDGPDSFEDVLNRIFKRFGMPVDEPKEDSDDPIIEHLRALADAIPEENLRKMAQDITEEMAGERRANRDNSGFEDHGSFDIAPGVHAHLVSMPAGADEAAVKAAFAKKHGVNPDDIHEAFSTKIPRRK